MREHEDRSQVHVLPLDGGEAQRATDLPLGVAGRPVWLPDERSVIVAARLSTDDPSLGGTRAYRESQERRADTAHVTERRLYRFWDTWLTDATTMHLLRVDLDRPVCGVLVDRGLHDAVADDLRARRRDVAVGDVRVGHPLTRGRW